MAAAIIGWQWQFVWAGSARAERDSLLGRRAGGGGAAGVYSNERDDWSQSQKICQRAEEPDRREPRRIFVPEADSLRGSVRCRWNGSLQMQAVLLRWLAARPHAFHKSDRRVPHYGRPKLLRECEVVHDLRVHWREKANLHQETAENQPDGWSPAGNQEADQHDASCDCIAFGARRCTGGSGELLARLPHSRDERLQGRCYLARKIGTRVGYGILVVSFSTRLI
jgi:hypothetical protein